MEENVFEDIELTEEEKREEELLKTIKMEPILSTTLLVEEEDIKKKKRQIRRTDYLLGSLIFVLTSAIVYIFIALV